MTLHKRTLLAIGLTFAGLITALYVSSQAIVLDSFARQEEQDSRLNVERVRSALADEVTALQGTTRDWAYWDDTYAYIDAHASLRQLSDRGVTFPNLCREFCGLPKVCWHQCAAIAQLGKETQSLFEPAARGFPACARF